MKKGFTLVELLAVIAVLAIIALIAVPLIVSVVADSKQRAAVLSGEQYVKSINYKISQEEINGHIVPDGEYVIGENELEVETKNGEDITGGYLIGESEVTWAGLCINKYSVGYYDGAAFIEKTANYCLEDTYVFVEPEGTLLSAICESDNGASIYDNESKFIIKTVEDLVCLSNTVESGKNFSGKEIYLLSDLDLSSTASYKSYTTKKYGDINGNGTIESLFVELTTGAGFKPIGNNNKPFSGTFLGYAFTISNLMINRTTSYVGLFGYNAGVISGIRFKDLNITGGGNVGSVAGYNTGTVKNVDIRGQIKGTGNSVGGVVGYTTGSAKNFIVKASIEGNNMVAGVGNNHGSGANIVGVIYDTTVKSPATSGTYQIGKATTYNSTSTVRVSNTELIINVGRQYSYDGTAFGEVTIASVDGVLDTYIGGDNDSDGYYFDYDANGTITVYSIDRTPLRIEKLKGSGIETSPYLIRNAKDWKIAAATVSENNKYYVLMADIDFQGKDFYPLGTGTTPFTGNFNGKGHTISNINVDGYQYTGVFGYNSGTVGNLVLNNININSYTSNAGIVGYNAGTINGMKVRNAIIMGTGSVGGIAGTNMSLIKNIDVQATVTGTGNSVSGVAGYSEGTIKEFVAKVDVEGNGVAGVCNNHGNGANIVGVVYDSDIKSTATSGTPNAGKATVYNSTGTVKVSNTTITYPSSGRSYSYDGTEFGDVTIASVDGALDTYIGGDTNGDGFYFDYNDMGKLELFSLDERPIRNTLSGSGTEADPYLIRNSEEWKMATATIDATPKYYKLVSNIDFNNRKFYPMGTGTVKFNGIFDGDGYIVSNVTLKGYQYTGISGYNTGTIKNLYANNINIDSYAGYAGIVGYNTGTINGIKARNINITGPRNLGGITGTNMSLIKNVDVQANVIGNGASVSGVAGYSEGTIKEFIVKANVEGNLVAGVCINHGNGDNLVGIVYDSDIRSIATSGSPQAGKATTYNNTNSVKVSNTTITYPSSGRSYSYDGVAIGNVTISSIDGTLDSYIGGDDGDGYYFDYNENGKIEMYSTKERPISVHLSGAGTESNPYLIRNTDDWRMATATIDETPKYYRITNDINFANKNFYPMGTNTVRFNGVLDGNHNTISNVNISGYTRTGIIGFNAGTLKNINFNNVTINNGADTSGIVAYNSGTINGIKARNLSISGGSSIYSTIGGISGVNTGSIKNVDVQGNFVGTANLVGGIIGTLTSTGTLENFAFTGSVTGPNIISGAVGKNETGYWTTITGVVYDTTITCSGNGTACAKAAYYNGPKNVKIYNTQLIKEGNREWSYDGTAITEKTLEAVNDAMDTTINGDDDGDGYYFTLNNGEYELIPVN